MMTGAPRKSFKAMLINTFAIGLLIFIAIIAVVWLYEVLAPLNNWPDIQWPENG